MSAAGAPSVLPEVVVVPDRVRELARDVGFDLVRFASAQMLAGARASAESARAEGRLAEMRWMDEDWIRRATDPERFVAGARTVIVLGLPCAAPELNAPATGPARGRVARYAAGRDYHRVFESRLRRFAKSIREEFNASARSTVDYGPLLERPWAARSGMGWLGKSTMLLAPGLGPWVLLGVVATDLVIEPDAPLKKTCGACERCIVACPTGAISPDGYVLDARLCISYHTIENRGPIPRELRPKFGDWVFGCDDCLTSCPVGRHAIASHPDLVPATTDGAFPVLAELLDMDEASFVERFRGRAITRAKRDGMARNACVALGNVGTEADLPVLYRALRDQSALVRGHAAWAISALVERLGLGAARPHAALGATLAGELDPSVREELEWAIANLGPCD